MRNQQNLLTDTSGKIITVTDDKLNTLENYVQEVFEHRKEKTFIFLITLLEKKRKFQEIILKTVLAHTTNKIHFAIDDTCGTYVNAKKYITIKNFW